MRRRSIFFLLCFVVASWLFPQSSAAASYDRVTIETSKTSIYIGTVTLSLSPLNRAGGVYTSDYKAKVFPYFFANEHGKLSIAFSDDDLAHLAKGDPVEFKGSAENSDNEARRIEGRAVPNDAKSGKIKVRVFVSKKIQLIFNTSYRFD